MTNPMMKRVFLLDMSGSMQSCINDTIGGFNTFVEDQKPLGGTMTLVLFDHEILTLYSDTPIADVPPLTKNVYTPRGSTALLDAIGQTLKTIETEGSEDVAWSVIILTDGEENTSRTYTKAHIKDLINAYTQKGVTFLYLGANQDAFHEASNIGIAVENTMNYSTNDTPSAFITVSSCMRARSQGIQLPLSPAPPPATVQATPSGVQPSASPRLTRAAKRRRADSSGAA